MQPFGMLTVGMTVAINLYCLKEFQLVSLSEWHRSLCTSERHYFCWYKRVWKLDKFLSTGSYSQHCLLLFVETLKSVCLSYNLVLFIVSRKLHDTFRKTTLPCCHCLYDLCCELLTLVRLNLHSSVILLVIVRVCVYHW